jgi:thiol-disulfide isomerase/thioredoxin
MAMGQIVGEQDILFFRLPFCPKCRVVANHIKSIREEHPEITVREINIVTNFGLARRMGMTTTPALLVRGRPLNGLVTREAILEALGLSST